MKKFLLVLIMIFALSFAFACSEDNKENNDDNKQNEVVNEYTVTFVVNGEKTEVKVKDGEKAVKPADPVKEGYVFKGWYVGEKEYDFGAVTADATVTAKFEEVKPEVKEYTVTFAVDGEKTEVKVAEGEKAVKPVDPVKEGYVFKGWFVGEEAYDFEKAVTSDLELVAKFEEVIAEYTVKFVVDGAEEVQTVKEGEKAVKPVDPEKDGYVFKGWFVGEEEYDFSAVTADVEVTAKFEEVVSDLTPLEMLEQAANTVTFPEVIRGDINLPKEVAGFYAEWNTSNKKVLTKEGIYTYVEENIEVTLSLTLIYGNDEEFYDKDYVVIVGPYEDTVAVEVAKGEYEFVSEIKTNYIKLPKEFNYGVTGTWSVNKEFINVETGEISEIAEEQIVKFTLKLQKGEAVQTIVYTVVVFPYTGFRAVGHNIVEEAKDFKGTFENVEFVNGKVVLVDGATSGTYTSVEIDTLKFEEVVGSWNCITGLDRTCELKVSVCINGTWSKYFTYGEWGLGKDNYYYNQTDTNVKMSVDEIILLNGKQGEKIKYQVVLKRNSASAPSPELARVGFTLSMEDYTYEVDVTGLPSQADWDLPKLYQHDVRSVGGVICSPTTTTMLLKYRGLDFSEQAKTYKNASSWGVYEHGYIASLAADPGHNSPTYGNWTYNMAVAGAFGRKALVVRMYSWEELKYYLATVGPVGATIGGNFGIYSTNGHLIVVRGYKEVNGNTTVICNDPNVSGVYYEVSLDIFMNAWHRNNSNSGVIYIVE